MDIYLENFGERQSHASTLAGKIVSVAGRQVITGVVDGWSDSSVWQNRRCWFAFSTIGLSFRLWCIFLRRPFPLRFIFGFYFHNVYLASQLIISKENRISEKQVISRYVCTECQSAFSFYLVSNGSRLAFLVTIAVGALLK